MPAGERATADLLIVGGGAAGLWAALRAAARARARGRTGLRIAVADSRTRLGAKILMSGGTRCNLTHAEVRPDDFRGASPRRVAHFLRAHPAGESVRIFTQELGLPVKQEPGGKLFPADDSAASVLGALLDGIRRAGIPLLTGCRMRDLDPPAAGGDGCWVVHLAEAPAGAPARLRAPRLLLATGGCSYPRTGSDGSAWEILRRLGHRIVPPVPALTPLRLRGGLHRELSGLSLPARLTLQRDGRADQQSEGPVLWTHFGISGPAVLDLSGHWARARADQPQTRLEVRASFLPGETPASAEALWLVEARQQPARTVQIHFGSLPHRFLRAVAEEAGAEAAAPLAQTRKEVRRRLLARLLDYPLPVEDVSGFGQAEVTSGGVPLEEVDDGLESKLLPGLHLAGEMLHVDGRLGGFNFQWAWSSGAVAGTAAVDRCPQRSV